jgi:5-methylcytosine-specific restriction protein A
MSGAPTVCSNPRGCPNLTPSGLCPSCRAEQRSKTDARRGTSTERGYDARWRRTRASYLRDHPACECDDCTDLPFVERGLATDVDHIDGLGPAGPRGHDPTNLRAMAHACHSRRTARDQPGGWNA